MRKYVAVNERGRRIGEDHPRATLSNDAVDLIRELHEDEGRSYGYIAIKMKISVNTIKKICRYERRAQIPERWVRVD